MTRATPSFPPTVIVALQASITFLGLRRQLIPFPVFPPSSYARLVARPGKPTQSPRLAGRVLIHTSSFGGKNSELATDWFESSLAGLLNSCQPTVSLSPSPPPSVVRHPGGASFLLGRPATHSRSVDTAPCPLRYDGVAAAHSHTLVVVLEHARSKGSRNFFYLPVCSTDHCGGSSVP